MESSRAAPSSHREEIATLVGFALVVFAVCSFGILLTRHSGRIASIWLANAVQLAMLVHRQQTSHRVILSIGFVANVLADLYIGDRVAVALVLSLSNSLEVALSRLLLRQLGVFDARRLIGWHGLKRFVLTCGIVAPAVSASVAAIGLRLLQGTPVAALWESWYAADALGFLVLVPILSATTLADLSRVTKWPQLVETLGLLAIVALTASAAFFFNRYKLLWLVFPSTLLATIRLGLVGANLSTVVTSLIGIWLVLSGKTLNMGSGPDNLRSDIGFLQILLAGQVLTLLPVGAILQALRDAEETNREVTESLVAANRLNQRIFDVSPAGILIYDDAGKLIRVNDAACRIIGHTESELLKQNFRALPSWEKSGLLASANAALATEQPVRGEAHTIASSGKELFIDYVFKTFQENKQTRLLLIVIDTAERTKAQAERWQTQRDLQMILDNLDGLVVSWDKDLRCRFANRQSEHWLGKSAAWMKGRSMAEILGPEWVQAAMPRIEAVLRGESSRTQVNIQSPSGQIEALVSFVPDFVPSSEVVNGFFALGIDVTQLKDAERGAQAASLAKTEFLANMSHEIRTPLNSVIGYSTLLLDTPLSMAQSEYVSAIRTAGDALLAQINAILDLSKIEAGKLELEMVPCLLRPAIEESIEILAESARKKGLSLTYLLASDCPNQWLCDPGRLRQVLINLIGNAVKFTDSGDVIIRVSRTATATQPLLLFEVEDTGPGIRPEDLPKLFQPFSQADASMSRRHGGSGLGLFLCRRIVESLGGTIGVRSVKSRGTVFSFTVPLIAESLTDSDPGSLVARNLGKQVVVIEPHGPTQQQLTQMFAALGMATLCSEQVEQAVLLLHERHKAQSRDYPPVLAVLGQGAEDGHALAVTERLRALPQLASLPVILLRPPLDGTSPSLPAGTVAMESLRRPLRLHRLSRAVRDLLGSELTDSGKRRRKRPPSTEITLSQIPARLLLAEDNPANQRLAVLMLQKLGCRVDVAANGREAVSMVSRFPYDLIMMDCQMPELDGLRATEEIRRMQPPVAQTPIVALTANAFRSDQESCLAVGMNDFLSKPLTLEQLLPVLRRWLPKHFAPATSASRHDISVVDEVRVPFEEIIAEVQSVKARMEELRSLLDEATLKQSRALAYEEWEARMSDAEKAIAAGQLDLVGKHVHRLAGSALELGANRLAQRCRSIEAAAKKNDTPAIESMYVELTGFYQSLLVALAAAGMPMND